MSEAFSLAPEPDTSRVPRRDGQSQAPVAVDRNQAMQRAMDAQAAKPPPPPPEPERPPDPAVELIKPLEEMPKWESEHVFKLAHPVRTTRGMITEITMRAPNGGDVFEIGGLPTRTQWMPSGMTVEMDTERFKRWALRLTNLDANTINACAARDVRAMYEWLNAELNQAGN